MVDPNNIGRPTRARDAFDPALDYESESPKLTLVPDEGGKITREITGYGLWIRSGVKQDLHAGRTNTDTLNAAGASVSTAPLPKITFLVRNENGDGGFTTTRQWKLHELYNGAMLPGRFDKIEVDWSSTTALVPPLVVRVIQGANRVVPTATDRPSVMNPGDSWDYISSHCILPTSGTGPFVLWDDHATATNAMGGYDGAGYSLPSTLPTIAASKAAMSMGNDWRQGPHHPIKRRIYGSITSESSDSFDVCIAQYAADDPTTTSIMYWYGGRSIARDLSSVFSTVDSCTFFAFGGRSFITSPSDHASAANTRPGQDGLILPPKSICYIQNTSASAAQTLLVNLWFGPL
jgi:hypothetical protein